MKRFWRKNKKEKVIMAVNKMLESEHNGQYGKLTLDDLDRAMAYYKNFHMRWEIDGIKREQKEKFGSK